MRLKTLLAGGAALAGVLLAQPAFAASVSLSSIHSRTEIVYEAALGEINNVTVVEAPDGVYMITDLNAAITPQSTGCVSISLNAVRCQVRPAFDDEVIVITKDGADSVDVASRFAFVRGGPGPDTLSGAGYLTSLWGGLGDDRLIGRSSDQQLRGGAGADSLDGGAGDDRLEGGAGTDVIAGGPGNDTVSYEDHRTPVRITLDGRANDGAPGENDWVRDVESADGSSGRTTFIGNASPNEFNGGEARDLVRAGPGDDLIFSWGGSDVVSGGPGDDVLIGSYGADVIRGGRGNDFLNGGWGADYLGGGRGRDHLVGGRRNDVLRGGPGGDRLSGHSGTDVLYTRDRTRDRVRGGLGHDRAQVDPIDALFSVELLF